MYNRYGSSMILLKLLVGMCTLIMLMAFFPDNDTSLSSSSTSLEVYAGSFSALHMLKSTHTLQFIAEPTPIIAPCDAASTAGCMPTAPGADCDPIHIPSLPGLTWPAQLLECPAK